MISKSLKEVSLFKKCCIILLIVFWLLLFAQVVICSYWHHLHFFLQKNEKQQLEQSTELKHVNTWWESDLTLPNALPFCFLVPALYFLPDFSQPLVCYWRLTSVHCSVFLNTFSWAIHRKIALYVKKKKTLGNRTSKFDRIAYCVFKEGGTPILNEQVHQHLVPYSPHPHLNTTKYVRLFLNIQSHGKITCSLFLGSNLSKERD